METCNVLITLVVFIWIEKDLKEAYNCYRIGANKGYKPSAEMCDRILAFVHKQNASENVN